jgi:hypothetical protein
MNFASRPNERLDSDVVAPAKEVACLNPTAAGFLNAR